MGYISSGLFSGQTVWSMLYATSALATLFCLTVIVTRHSAKYPVATIFRQVLFVGFGLLTLTIRSLVIEGPLPPDGLVLINHSAESLTQFPISREALLTFDSPDEVLYLGRAACVFIQRSVLILPDEFLTREAGPRALTLPSIFMKGALIRRHQAHQTYLEISETDLPLIESRIQIELQVNGAGGRFALWETIQTEKRERE